jgi:hypothetical protein
LLIFFSQESDDVKKLWSENRLEIMASTQTVLSVLEKEFDGAQITGLSATVGAVSEGLKALQVRAECISLLIISLSLQTNEESEEAISDAVKTVEHAQKSLTDSITFVLDPSLVASPEGKQRITELMKWVFYRAHGEISQIP